MQLDKELISRLEKLARLQLSETEREKLRTDLERILHMVDKLRELDTAGVEPLVYMNEHGNVWREDVVGEHLPVEQALQNAPNQDGKFFRVPKVIE